jgi:uncharacterized protein involved in exopolysaccharide biosynthesis
MTNSPKDSKKVYDAFDLIKFAWDKKWILLGITFLAGLISIFVTLSMPDRFKSTVVMFPAASISISKSLVETSSISMSSQGVLSFGREEDGERMLQILNSNQIKNHIYQKFDLMNHYEIDFDKEKFPYTKLENQWKSNVKFRQTEYLSIEITVFDEDPVYAADIANEIAIFVDSTVHMMQKERAVEAYNIVEREYNAAQAEIKVLSDSLQKIRSLGIIDYQSQAAALNEAYAAALAKGNNSSTRAIDQKLTTLAKYGGIYVELSKKLESSIERLGMLKDKHAAAKVDVEQTLPQIFIVDNALVAERKSEPKRSIIVFLSTVSTFVFVLLILLIYDNAKDRFN